MPHQDRGLASCALAFGIVMAILTFYCSMSPHISVVAGTATTAGAFVVVEPPTSPEQLERQAQLHIGEGVHAHPAILAQPRACDKG